MTDQSVPAESRPEWMPFDTAPEYPVEIIAYRPDAGVFAAESVRDDDNDSLTWFTAGGDEDLVGDLPTHWMPLPPPPDKPAEPPRTAAVATAARVSELEREVERLKASMFAAIEEATSIGEISGMERAARIVTEYADKIIIRSLYSEGMKDGARDTAILIRRRARELTPSAEPIRAAGKADA